ncbi:hypothetical protein AB7W15_03295 [Morganella morganii]
MADDIMPGQRCRHRVVILHLLQELPSAYLTYPLLGNRKEFFCGPGSDNGGGREKMTDFLQKKPENSKNEILI